MGGSQCMKTKAIVLSLICSTTLWFCLDLAVPQSGFTSGGKGRLVWSDEFDDDAIDRSAWNVITSINGGGNGEFQEYTDDGATVTVQNGRLAITPTLTTLPRKFLYNGTYDLGDCSDTWPGACKRTGTANFPLPGVRSGKVTTQGKFAFTYGVLEARLRPPRGDWLWPAFWLLPDDQKYGIWQRPVAATIFERFRVKNRDRHMC